MYPDAKHLPLVCILRWSLAMVSRDLSSRGDVGLVDREMSVRRMTGCLMPVWRGYQIVHVYLSGKDIGLLDAYLAKMLDCVVVIYLAPVWRGCGVTS